MPDLVTHKKWGAKPRVRWLVPLIGLGLLAWAATACQGRQPVSGTMGLVAVLPVVNGTGKELDYPEQYNLFRPSRIFQSRVGDKGQRVLQALREEIQDRLIGQGHPALPLSTVDARLEEFAPPLTDQDTEKVARALGADALLLTTLRYWDASHLTSSSTVVIAANFSLHQGGKIIWSRQLNPRRVNISNLVLARSYRNYLRRFVQEALEDLRRLG